MVPVRAAEMTSWPTSTLHVINVTDLYKTTQKNVSSGIPEKLHGPSVPKGLFAMFMAAIILTVNVITLIVLLQIKSLKTQTKYFLLSLTIADLTVGFLILWHIHANFTGQWTLGKPFCAILGFVFYLCLCVSVWHIMLLSFDRLLAIWKPLYYEKLLPQNASVALIIVSWVLCCIFTLLPIFTHQYIYIKNERLCGTSSLKSPAMMFVFAFVLGLPYLVVFCLNIALAIVAYKEIKRLSKDSHIHGGQYNSNHIVRRQVGAAVTVLLVVVVFSITWLPCLIWNVHQAATSIPIPMPGEFIIMWMGVSNSMFNFFIYFITNRHFRIGVLKLLHCKSKETQLRRERIYAISGHTHSNENSYPTS